MIPGLDDVEDLIKFGRLLARAIDAIRNGTATEEDLAVARTVINAKRANTLASLDALDAADAVKGEQ